MGCCCACSTIGITKISTSQFILIPTKIFSFHPATVMLHGVEVKAPWGHQDALYPPPHPTFLEMHYFSSISRAMKGGGDDCELDDDDDDDYEELCNQEEVKK